MWVFYFFDSEKTLYLNTQGLCVTELLFRGFWLIDCCVKEKKKEDGEIPTSFIVLFIV